MFVEWMNGLWVTDSGTYSNTVLMVLIVVNDWNGMANRLSSTFLGQKKARVLKRRNAKFIEKEGDWQIQWPILKGWNYLNRKPVINIQT